MAKTPPKVEQIVAVDRPSLTDLDGNDALLVAPPEIRAQVHRAAIASMPLVYRTALAILTKSKNEKMVIEAMKFLRELSEGEISAKSIDAAVKTLTDEEILAKLDGRFEDVD